MPHDKHLHNWLDMAKERIAFQGLPARICWVGLGDRARLGLAFNEMVKNNQKHYIKPFNEVCWIDYCNSNPKWWQTNDDRHFGKTGHLEFFQYLYGYIQKDLI